MSVLIYSLKHAVSTADILSTEAGVNDYLAAWGGGGGRLFCVLYFVCCIGNQ